MSPEQCLGEAARSGDRHLRHGGHPVRAADRRAAVRGGKRDELIQKIVAGPPAEFRRKDVPPPLRAICLKAIERNPAHRYASAAAMAEHLRRYLDSKPLPFLMRHRELVRSSRKWGSVGAIGLAIAASVFAGRAFLFPPKPDPRPMVVVETVPVGAKAFPVPHGSQGRPDLHGTGAVRPAEQTPAAFRLEPGDYLVVAALEDGSGRFHEVYRHVPGSDEPAVARGSDT